MSDHIVIGDIRPRIQYTADGTQTDFTYPFPIFAAADLKVYLGEVLQAAGYTVAGAGLSAGGTVSFAAAPAAGTKVTLLRALAIARNTDFQEGGAFRAKTINDELDRQTAFVQEAAERIERALVAGPTESAAPLVLPPIAARANALLGFDAAGTPIAAAGAAGGVAVSAAMLPLVQAADAAAARAALGLGTAATRDHGTGDANLPLGTQSRLARIAESVKTADYTVAAADAGAMLVANKATAIAFALPAAASLGAGFAVMARNIGAGDLTIDPAGAETINAAATLVLKQNEAAMLWTDGTAWRANVWAVGGGKLVQSVYAEYANHSPINAAIPNDDTIPQITEGTEVLTVNISPKNVSNLLRIKVTGNAAGAGGNIECCCSLFRDSNSNARAATRMVAVVSHGQTFALVHQELASSIAATVFKVRFGPLAVSTVYLNGDSGGRKLGGTFRWSIIVDELAP